LEKKPKLTSTRWAVGAVGGIVLGIIAAQLGAGQVTGIDAAPDTAEVGQLNAERLGVGERTRFLHGDLFEPRADEATFDLIIGDVSGIPDEFARISGWFPDGRGGGPTGVELP
jgi:tRNA A58 N-methylase Trm61